MIRLLLAIPILVALAVACGSSGSSDDRTASLTSVVEDELAVPSTSGTEATTAPSTTPVEDFVAEADDFVSLYDMTRVRDLFVDNRLGHLDEALAVANDPDGGVYPVGTIIQLVPQEAMVKRAPGFAPAVADWEFFNLDVSAEGTVIVDRGGAEVENRFGGSCAECHIEAEVRFDLVCENDHGCDELMLDEQMITFLQDADPRPRLVESTTTTPG